MDEKNANQVIYNGKTLIDLTGDSVTPETLGEGETAHDAAGNPITGVGKKTSVLYTEQVLPEEAQTQARENIGAAGSKDVSDVLARFTPIVAESEDGVSYVSAVPWITELTVGARFTMLPDKLSTSLNPTLNVNGLGAKYLRCLTGYNNAATANGAFAGWISADRPIDVIYNGTYWITNMQRTSVSALYGTLKVEGGGTGATTAEEARKNLGALGVDDIESDIFVAVYGQTTMDELDAAYNAGKLLVMKWSIVGTDYYASLEFANPGMGYDFVLTIVNGLKQADTILYSINYNEGVTEDGVNLIATWQKYNSTYVVEDAVLCTEQTLADEQKAQARTNIGAASAEEIGNIDTALDEIIALQNSYINGVTA